MTKKLDFNVLDEPSQKKSSSRSARRWRDREPKLQMSLRMEPELYDKFRDLCETERRTNGGMLEVLYHSYMKQKKNR